MSETGGRDYDFANQSDVKDFALALYERSNAHHGAIASIAFLLEAGALYLASKPDDMPLRKSDIVAILRFASAAAPEHALIARLLESTSSDALMAEFAELRARAQPELRIVVSNPDPD